MHALGLSCAEHWLHQVHITVDKTTDYVPESVHENTSSDQLSADQKGAGMSRT